MYQRNHLKGILIVSLVFATVTVISYWLYELISVSKQKNGFNRKFIPVAIGVLGVLNRDSITGISGIVNKHLYFQMRRPGQLIVTDEHLGAVSSKEFYTGYDGKIASRFEYIMDSMRLFILAGNKPALIYGTPGMPLKQYLFPALLFSRCVPVSDNSFVFRGFDTSVHSNDQVFLKGNPVTGKIIAEKNLTEFKNDAGISSDGLLRFDKTTNKLVYVYFYKNKFICLDTNLHLYYAAHTIDTNKTNAIQPGTYRETKYSRTTNSSPIRTINKENSVFDGLLFNNSRLQADNENSYDFKSNDVIDIYSIEDGAYKGSFYIPLYKDEHLQRFKIGENILVVLYHHALVSYRTHFM